jgi:hypothetical protein
MRLAEAIKEKEFIEDSIHSLQHHIVNTSGVESTTDSKILATLIKSRFEELRNLYKKYQNFCVSIERAKAGAFIEVQSNKLSLLDALVIKQVFESKLRTLEGIYELSLKDSCVDLNDLFKELETTRLDVKTLSVEIEFALWEVEV